MAELDEEREWIVRSQQGDHEAFAQLVKRHQQMIHALTFRMTGSLADSEDLAQETFLSAYRNLAGYRAEARFSTWLYRVAMNHCLNWRGHQKRQGELAEQWRAEQDQSAAPDNGNLPLVQEALLKLDPKQRAAIVLTVQDGLNHAEAARILGCSETTVSWRVFAARRKLRWLLRHFKLEAGT